MRDPRAMLFSMHKVSNSFVRFKEHPDILCEFMLEDMEMESKLGHLRYDWNWELHSLVAVAISLVALHHPTSPAVIWKSNTVIWSVGTSTPDTMWQEHSLSSLAFHFLRKWLTMLTIFVLALETAASTLVSTGQMITTQTIGRIRFRNRWEACTDESNNRSFK